MNPSLFWSMMVNACRGFTHVHHISEKAQRAAVNQSHLFELLDLSLLEHGEDVGAGSLRPLLGFLGGLKWRK